jgi:hypothetical protein
MRRLCLIGLFFAGPALAQTPDAYQPTVQTLLNQALGCERAAFGQQTAMAAQIETLTKDRDALKAQIEAAKPKPEAPKKGEP